MQNVFIACLGGGGKKRRAEQTCLSCQENPTELTRVAANVFLLCFNGINLMNPYRKHRLVLVNGNKIRG